MLHSKWKSMVGIVEYLRQPTRCVFTGSLGPLHHVKSIALFTVSSQVSGFRASVVQWRPTLIRHDNGPAIWIDCDESEERAVKRAHATVELPGLLGWQGPQRSLGGGMGQQRLLFVLRFSKEGITPLDVKLYVRSLKETPGLETVLIGSRSLFQMTSAVLADMNGARLARLLGGGEPPSPPQPQWTVPASAPVRVQEDSNLMNDVEARLARL